MCITYLFAMIARTPTACVTTLHPTLILPIPAVLTDCLRGARSNLRHGRVIPINAMPSRPNSSLITVHHYSTKLLPLSGLLKENFKLLTANQQLITHIAGTSL